MYKVTWTFKYTQWNVEKPIKIDKRKWLNMKETEEEEVQFYN